MVKSDGPKLSNHLAQEVFFWFPIIKQRNLISKLHEFFAEKSVSLRVNNPKPKNR